MNSLNQACAKKNLSEILSICRYSSFSDGNGESVISSPYFGLFTCDLILRCRDKDIQDNLSEYQNYFIQKIKEKTQREEKEWIVQLVCNWTDSLTLHRLWNKMTMYNTMEWKGIKLWQEGMDVEEIDVFVIINGVQTSLVPLENQKNKKGQTYQFILFEMEPFFPIPYSLLPSTTQFFTHSNGFYNNFEWHLSWTFQELLYTPILKSRTFSTIVSDKYVNQGQILRTDFIEYLKEEIPIDIYGNSKFSNQGVLPSHKKNDGLFPYKYTFNAENTKIDYYITEKLIDAILAETLCFYWGAPNVDQILDPRAFILLPLEDFQASKEIILKSIQENEWEKRIEYIRAEKQRIINELQFFPRLYSILSSQETTTPFQWKE